MKLDHRLNAFRSDLADERLKGQVEADRFAAGIMRQVNVPVARLRSKPDKSTGTESELLFGERLHVFDAVGGWAWVQAESDGYVGYLPESTIGIVSEATHKIIAPRTFVYPTADLRRTPVAALSIASRIRVVDEVVTRGTTYFVTESGQGVIASHCLPITQSFSRDYVDVAILLIGTPYLWGGRSAFGIDCSGLVQLSMMMADKLVQRDTDMQKASIGHEVQSAELRRCDLVFWPGHVGMMENQKTLLHANGHTMSVAREPLRKATERMGAATAFRRPVS